MPAQPSRNDASQPSPFEPLEPRMLLAGDVQAAVFSIPNRRPEVTLRDPWPGETVHDRTPEFDWTGYDPDGDVLFYDFYLDDDPFVFDRPILATSTGTSSGLELKHRDRLGDGTYYWAVKARDTLGASDTSVVRSFQVRGEFSHRPDDHPDFNNFPTASVVDIRPGSGNGRTNGIIEQSDDSDLFEFTSRGNGRASIKLDPRGAFDTYLRVYNSKGKLIAQDDDWWAYSNDEVKINVKRGEKYFVLVTGDDWRDTGEYALYVQGPRANRKPTIEALGPNDGGRTRSPRPVFRWNSSDRDKGNVLRHVVFLQKLSPGEAVDPTTRFDQRYFMGNRQDFRVPKNASLKPGEYAWVVRVNDGKGGTKDTPTQRFTVRPPLVSALSSNWVKEDPPAAWV